jgi:hypothetical protein
VEGEISTGANAEDFELDLPSLKSLKTTFFDQSFPSLNYPSVEKWNILSLTATNLTSFLLPAMTETEVIDISDNPFLTNISLPKLRTFNGSLRISNNPVLKTIQLPNLENMNDKLCISNNAEVTSLSLPALASAVEIDISDNISLRTLSIPTLGLVDESLTVRNNPVLSSLDFTKLTTINNGFNLIDNTALVSIDGFPKVASVGWDLDWTGSFHNASLPAIKFIGGRVNVQSSADTFSCPFPDIRVSGVVQGEGFVCSGRITNPRSFSVREYINITANNNEIRSSENLTKQGKYI